MAIRTYKVTLDSKNTIAPEPVYLRQGDKTGAVVIDATLTDNGSPVSLDGLTPMFKANTADGQAVIADSTGFNIVNASGGEFTYQVPNALSAIPGKIVTAYFSFSDASGSESTFDVAFIIKKAVDITKPQADDYITIIDGTLKSLQQKIDAMNTDVQTILNAYNQGYFYNKTQTDSKDAATLTSAKSYADTQHAQVTEQLADIDAYKIGDGVLATMADLSQDVKEAMTGGSVAVVGENTVLSENITRNSVNVEHVSFLKGSRNLFNYNSLKDGYKLKENYGTLEEDSTMVTHEMYIPVLQSTTYCMSKINKNIVIHFYSYSKEYISQTSVDTTTIQTFTTPSNCYYIRLFTFLEVKNLLENFQIEIGTTLSEYNPYKEYIIPTTNIEDGEVITELSDVLVSGKNIIDSNLFVDDKALDVNNGKLTDSTSLMATEEYILAKPNTNYAITSVQGAMIFCFYDKNKAFISSINIDTSNTITTTSPNNTQYIRLCTFKIKRTYLPLQLEEGTKNTSYEAYGKYINKKYLNINTDSRFEGLIWNSLGDSITKMNDYVEGYQTKVAKRLGIGAIRNYGIGGTLLCLKDDDRNSDTAMCNRYVNMNDTADIITVMGGANDWSASRKLDSETNKYDKHTIGGAMRTIIEGLMTKYPEKNIIWLTCPPRMCIAFESQLNTNGEQVDNNGNTIEDLANKQIEVCNEYNIPCIDIHHKVGFNRHNIELFTAANDRGEIGTPDKVHMNNLGHERIASVNIKGFEEFIY